MKYFIIASAIIALTGCGTIAASGNNQISAERMWYPNKTTTFYSNNGQQAFYGVSRSGSR